MPRLLRLIYVDVRWLRPGTIGAYALAFVSTAIATVLRLFIGPYVDGAPFLTYFPAVIITTVLGGFGAGVTCVVLSTAAVDYFLLEPRFSFLVKNLEDLAELVLFGPLAFLCVMLVSQMRSIIEREEAERAWRAAKDHLQLALDTAQLGWWRYDPRRRAVKGDPRFKEIFDVAADEIPIEDIKTLVHPDDAERFLAERETASDAANPRLSPHEYRVQRRDGEVRWVEVRWFAYFDGDQRERADASVVGTVHDITERKQREEREHLLMREINHRTKNMLSVVDAIAHQTAARTPEGFIERFSERIQALAANQDLLIRNAWHGVEVEHLVHAQLAPFADLIGSRIVVRGPTLRLNAGSAQAVGLALHELTTNAGKYGALSNDTGCLDIGWRTEGETFTMSWTEHGGPPVSGPQRRGFGTVVMREMAEQSLDGKADLEYTPAGVTWRLTCPVKKALEAWEGSQESVARNAN